MIGVNFHRHSFAPHQNFDFDSFANDGGDATYPSRCGAGQDANDLSGLIRRRRIGGRR